MLESGPEGAYAVLGIVLTTMPFLVGVRAFRSLWSRVLS